MTRFGSGTSGALLVRQPPSPASPGALVLGGALAVGLLLVYSSTAVSALAVLAVIGAACLFIVFLRHPTLALLLTAAVIPLERIGRLTDDTSTYTVSLMRGIGLLALAAFLVNAAIRKQPLRITIPLVLYAVYCCLSLTTIAYSSDVLGTVRACGAILSNVLFYFLVVNLVQSRTMIRRVILVWLAASVILGLYSAYDWHLGSGRAQPQTAQSLDPGLGAQSTERRLSTVWEDQAEWESFSGKSVRRSMGPTSHAGVYGINLILTLPFFFYALRVCRGRAARGLLVLGLAVVAYNLLLTNTRAAILLAAGVVVFSVLRRLLRVGVGHVLAAVALWSVLFLLPGDTHNRVLNPSNYTAANSAALRIRLGYWAAGVRAIGDHWLTGVGVGNQKVVPEYVRVEAPEQTTVHNEYLQTALEVGVPGWLVFFGFVALLLAYSVRAARTFRRSPETQPEYWLMVASQIATLAVLVYGLQADVFHFPLKGWWLIAGITAVLHDRSHELPHDERGAAASTRRG